MPDAAETGRRPRILVVPSWYTVPDRPQKGIFVKEQAVALAARCDVRVALFGHYRFRDYSAYRREGGGAVQRYVDCGIMHLRSAGWNPLPVPSRRGQRRAVHAVAAALTDAGWLPDVIHVHSVWPGGGYGAALAGRLGVPYVITEHRTNLTALCRKRRVHDEIIRYYRAAAVVIAVSPGLAAEMSTLGVDGEITVVPNMVDTDYFTPLCNDCEHGDGSILFVGTLWRKKGVDVLLDAAALFFQQADGPSRLVIAGDGPERTVLEGQAQRAGIGDRCRFEGNVSRPRVRELMRTASLFVLPSRRETFGIVALESIACGTPVVATRSGGPEFFVTDDVGVLVPSGRPDALAHAVMASLRSRDRFRAGRLHAFVRNSFSRAVVTARLIDEYERIRERACRCC